MSWARDLCARIEDRSARVAVVGLGYVGLPLAALIAEVGFRVRGVDLKTDRVALIASGQNPIAGREPGLDAMLERGVTSGRLQVSSDPASLAGAQIVVVCVETPVGPDRLPDNRALEVACRQVAAGVADGALVIVESTVAPGTMEGVVGPAVRLGGRRLLLGHCPERVMPGRLLANLRGMSRVLGAEAPEVAEAMAAFYSTYVEAELDRTDLLTAELVKTVENAYRDVNIAFANQVALICDAAGADVWAVRDLVNKSPGRQMLLPGGGVGGHCIPKDPWLLAAAAGGVDTGLLREARRLNGSMPSVVAQLVAEVLGEAGLSSAGAKVAVLGYAYLEDSDDTRDSPSAVLVSELEALGCLVSLHDPFVPGMDGEVTETVAGCDCLVAMVGHAPYRKLDLPRVAAALRRPLMVDARRIFGPDRLGEAGFHFRVLGDGRSARRQPESAGAPAREAS